MQVKQHVSPHYVTPQAPLLERSANNRRAIETSLNIAIIQNMGQGLIVKHSSCLAAQQLQHQQIMLPLQQQSHTIFTPCTIHEQTACHVVMGTCGTCPSLAG